jgi:MFS family permease
VSPVTVLGICQILGWGSSFYLPAVLANPIAAELELPFSWVIGGVSFGLLVAGLASRQIGNIIHRHGGRPVLIASSLLFALGLVILSRADHLAVYYAAWTIIGLGMGCGLYDASFSTLGRIYGDVARRPITALTLWGGFASTVCWPITAYLSETVGWRDTCLVYAAVHLLLGLPLYAVALPRGNVTDRPATVAVTAANQAAAASPWVFPILASAITLGSALVSITGIHLLTMLQAQDIALATAVTFGALIGPSQVGARVVEIVFGNRYHPIWTLGASTILMAGGLALLSSSSAIVAVAIVIYGSGVGIQSIARGTVPLVLYGKERYALVIGRLAMCALIAQSVSPTLAAMLFEAVGVPSTLHILTVLAATNIALVAVLGRLSRI